MNEVQQDNNFSFNDLLREAGRHEPGPIGAARVIIIMSLPARGYYHVTNRVARLLGSKNLGSPTF